MWPRFDPRPVQKLEQRLQSSKVVTPTWYSQITHVARITLRRCHTPRRRTCANPRCNMHFSLLSSTLRWSPIKYLDTWGELCGGKPCPYHGSIRHRWWSSGQDLCFQCRGSPSDEGSNPSWGRSWSDTYSPPKYSLFTYTHKPHPYTSWGKVRLTISGMSGCFF